MAGKLGRRGSSPPAQQVRGRCSGGGAAAAGGHRMPSRQPVPDAPPTSLCHADPTQTAPTGGNGPAQREVRTPQPKHAASTASAAASPARRARPPAAAAAAASAPSPPKQQQQQRREQQQRTTVQLSQTAAAARTERLRSALQQLRAAKPKQAAAGGDSCSRTAAAPPLPTCSDGRLPSPPRYQSPPLAQHPACACQRDGQTRQGSLDSSMEDLFDAVSLSLLAPLRLGSSSRQASPAQQPKQQWQQQLVAALSPAVYSFSSPCMAAPLSSELHAAARQALRQAAAEPEMPLMLPPGHVASRQLEPCAADLQQRLDELRRSLATPRSKCAAAGGAPRHSMRGGPSAGDAGTPRRRLAGELVMTRSPSAAASGPEGALIAQQPSSAHSRLAAGAGGGSAGGGSDRAAAERLAALLGWSEPAGRGLQATLCVSSGSAAVPHGVPTLLPPHLQPSVAVSGSWQAAVATTAPRPAAVIFTPPRALQQQRSASTPAPPNAVTSTATQPAAVAGGSGDILEAWRSRRQAAQAPQLAEKYSRYLSLQQGGSLLAAQQGALAAAPAAVAAVPAAGHRSLPAARRAVAHTEYVGSAARRLVHFEQQQQQQQSLPRTVTPVQQKQKPQQQWQHEQQPALDPEPSDILERWRARRRQQGQTSSGGADYGALLTLQPPGSLLEPRPPAEVPPAPAMLALPPAPAPQPALQLTVPSAAAQPAATPASAPPAGPAVLVMPAAAEALPQLTAPAAPDAGPPSSTGIAVGSCKACNGCDAAAERHMLPAQKQSGEAVMLPAAAEELTAAAVAGAADTADEMSEASDLQPAASELSQAAEANSAAAAPVTLPSRPPSAAASSGRATPHSPSGQWR